MILVFDAGNSETTVGLFDGDSLKKHWRLTTDTSRTPDELTLFLNALLEADSVKVSTVKGVAIGSVVPRLTPALVEACTTIFGKAPVVVNGNSKLPIKLEVDEPMTVGADRILNTLAASRLYKRDTIVVDLGTATTYDCITADGVFLGGAIQPGVMTSAESLFRKTAQLPATEIRAPKSVIGKNTNDCIRAGVLFGAAESIEGMVRRIKREWPNKVEPFVVGTGGLAEILAPHCPSFNKVEPFLTLEGLRIAHTILDK